MHNNGFVDAKMVRAKLLHKFLWSYLTNLPDWPNAFNSENRGYDVKNPNSTCQLFALEEAIKEMPLQLFLQVVGTAKKVDNMVAICKLGVRLSGLPFQEYKRLMDTLATGRLSRIINILYRLKLIQLVREGHPEDESVLQHAVLRHAMELKPYIEEPLSRSMPSSCVNANRSPRIRHDFVFSKQDAVDAYWETLEYCYATAAPADASHAFPGSSAPEVFHPRSWTSLRVMTAEQHMELLNRVTNVDREKKISLKDCIRIARELDLTVEQVLRISYSRRQSRLCGIPRKLIISKEQGNYPDAKSSRSSSRKRKRSDKDVIVDHAEENDNSSRSSKPKISNPPLIEEKEDNSLRISPCGNHDIHLPAPGNDNHRSDEHEYETHDEDSENHAFIKQCAFLNRKPMRRKRFTWTDKSDRQLVMQYARHRAALGARFFRVDCWDSLPDLPAPPDTCRRRMAVLNRNDDVRKAVLRFCNLLGERYATYLDTARRIRENVSLPRNKEAIAEDGLEMNFEQHSWDDFEDPDIKHAIEEVLRYTKMAKLEYLHRVGSKQGKEWSDIPPADGVTQDEQINTSIDPREEIQNNMEGGKSASIVSPNGRNTLMSHRSHGKFVKLLNNRVIIKRRVCESLAVANAVELLKLVFLCTSAAPQVQTSLAATLRQYSESDIFTAFNYLKEKNFMVAGQGTQPYVLSQKFWCNAASSPFPVDTGKRAANFSRWLGNEEKNLMEDGISLTSDLQCGEVVHLFALVFSGELVISPSLPEEGVGEPEESNSSNLPMEQLDQFGDQFGDGKVLKRKSDNVELSSDEIAKKQKLLSKIDSNFCTRREKGFPGIQVVLNRETIPRDEIIWCTTDKEIIAFSSSCDKNNQGNPDSFVAANDGQSLSSRLNSCQQFLPGIQSEASQSEPHWDAISSYAACFVPAGSNKPFTFSAELFRSMHSAIRQAGEQGLTLKEISETMELQGVEFAEVIVATLEVFKFCLKVNGYDTVRVVDSSYRSKYLINSLGDRNHGDMPSHVKSQSANSGESEHPSPHMQERTRDFQETCVNLSDGHKVTILDVPCDPALLCMESTNNEGTSVVGESAQKEVPSAQKKEAGLNNSSAGCLGYVPQPILPWINGDGSMNTVVYKGFTRRVLGTVMQNPGIMEDDIIHKMDVLNPQSCRRLLEMLVLDNHLSVRTLYQTTCATPNILQSLLPFDLNKPKLVYRKHFFANPMSTFLL
uniref:B-block binding subunit of TFIIIC domain-containing protein n=1 Tax=Ananas comosus var. bracteatus TaxID=296719 RepID=A0A6V7QLD2_ANACO|nr:unnamed protein product [Ananas comosus var. bracteatus]